MPDPIPNIGWKLALVEILKWLFVQTAVPLRISTTVLALTGCVTMIVAIYVSFGKEHHQVLCHCDCG